LPPSVLKVATPLMKLSPICLLLAVHTATAATVVFNNDTIIAAVDTTYDGSDVIVSNCVLTVDGPHSFNSLRVAATGVVTHTPLPVGPAGVIGVKDVSYRMMCSTNLVDWVPYGDQVTGSNALIEVLAPIYTDPMKFFRFKATP